MTAKHRRWSCAFLISLCLAAPVVAQEAEPAEEEPSLRPKIDIGLEARANYRDSEENRFKVPFKFPEKFLPHGQSDGFEETVNAGSHLEISVVTLLLNASWGDGLTAHGKVDFIDLYDRNPTSSDKKTDVDEAWLRFGIEPEPATLAPRGGAYLKIGKMPKFERQDDRHLESYGLVSTAFNRMEDTGVELGLNLGRHVYAKATATQGNPVFLRDPNALAGDNGQPELLRDFPDPALLTGIVILYDAEVEDIDLDGDPELGGGLGVRFADEAGTRGLDLLAWGYRRTLAKTVALEGTFYGGDLDILDGPDDVKDHAASLPIRGNEKREVGANLWLYLGGFSFFGQYVDQEMAGLPRTGIEGEASWRFELPLRLSIGDQQLFTYVAPAVRYSKLDNKFRNPKTTPAPSLAWDWEKVDAGVRLGVISGVDLTLEYADNTFILGSGARRDNNEFLTTLRWKV
jgi:hypothetical protein